MLDPQREPYTFNLWRNFVVDLVLGAAFLSFGFVRHGGSAVSGAGLVLAGLLAWPLLEYLVHRYLLHGPWHALRKEHMLHHRDPRWERLTAWYAHPLAGIATGAVIWVFSSVAAAALLMAGVIAGYTCFRTVHRVVHFHAGTLAPRFFERRLAVHELHHDHPDRYYGVTTSFWDRVFGTFRTP